MVFLGVAGPPRGGPAATAGRPPESTRWRRRPATSF